MTWQRFLCEGGVGVFFLEFVVLLCPSIVCLVFLFQRRKDLRKEVVSLLKFEKRENQQRDFFAEKDEFIM